mmetsp:Transcript_18098/g.54586  ORF Transcript_18098/g.54586 Transcript_18098/m.54586 type:complete len:389 (+) Transcript_18098:1386-2552(+)
MHDRARVGEHLFEHRQVDRVGDGDLALGGEGLEGGDVRLAHGERLGVGDALGDLSGVGRRRAQVVVGVRRVGELELLGKLGGRCGRIAREVERLLDDGLDGLGGAVQVEPLGKRRRLEELDGVGLGARPLLLILAATLVLWIGGRVALKAVRVHLQDGRPLLPHVVDNRTARLERFLEVAAVDLDAGHTVVLALHVDVIVGGNVGREGVDGAPIVNHNKEERQLLLCGRVEALGHTAVLGAALAHKDNGDAVVVLGALGVEHAVEKDGARRSSRVRKLLADERPAALEVGLLVVDVHRAARAAACAGVLSKELGHDGVGGDARGERVGVLAVVGELLVALLDGIGDERGDRLLTVVEVHEAADISLHVGLVARVLELAAELHHLIGLE